VRAAFLEQDPLFESSVVDSYKYAASVVSRVVSDGYIGMVKTIPQMYRFLYARAERATEIGPFRTWIHQFTAGNLRPLLQRLQPDIVICTHAFPCGVMAEYKRQFADAPLVAGVVTDFAVHAFWAHANVDLYAVAREGMREELAARGVPRDRVLACGIPVKPVFARAPENRNALRDRLGLPRDRSVVLLMGGGLGIGPLGTMIEALEEVTEPLCAVAIAGMSYRLEARVREEAHRVAYPIRLERFVENIHDYMHASDLIITKPGGLTTSEALTARLPLVLFKPLPGQEERNTRFLARHGVAMGAKNRTALAQTVQALLSSAERRSEMREAMGSLAKPNAAADLAAALRTLVERSNRAAIA
jgi:processive 1,2-diacylglycerol beta-glucosyltransferase